MKPMIFVPVTAEQAYALRDSGGLTPDRAYAATAELRREFDYGPDADEDADYAAQVFAALSQLGLGDPRIVLAVEVDRLPAAEGLAEFGEISTPPIRWRAVQAVFVADPHTEPATRGFAASQTGRSLPELWSDEAVHAFVGEHDLLWFAPTELDLALAGGDTGQEMPEPTGE